MKQDVVRELGYLTLGSRLKRIAERLQAQTQRILDEHELDVQVAQFPFLAAIDRCGSLTVGELADAIGVSQPGATRAVGDLVEAGLVETEASRVDQRRRSVTLTRKGQRLVDAGKRVAWPRIEAAVRDVCHGRDGSLLTKLAEIEDALADRPLDARARAKGARA